MIRDISNIERRAPKTCCAKQTRCWKAHALGPGGGQISRVVHVSMRADFGVFAEKYGFAQEGHTFIGKVRLRARWAHIS